MPEVIDLVGRRFGRLRVTAFLGRVVGGGGQKRSVWACLCDCGGETQVAGGNLRSSSIKSCGCLRLEVLDKTSHGLSGTSHYGIWKKILRRCNDPTDGSYKRYGGRGISVCTRWHDLENFVVDMGPRPAGTSIERDNNNGPYSKANCRWATAIEQANNKRNSRVVEFDGRRQTVAMWAREFGVSPFHLYNRLNKNPVALAFSAFAGSDNIITLGESV